MGQIYQQGTYLDAMRGSESSRILVGVGQGIGVVWDTKWTYGVD